MLVATMGTKDEAPPPVKTLLRRYNLRPQKRLGQHFLVDEGTLESIMSAAEPSSDDIVIEVGPGLGILTKKLAAAVARVVAVELDSRLVKALRKELADSSNVEIVHGDILKVAPQRLAGDYLASVGSGQSYKVVANLPYYITSPVLRHFLQASLKRSYSRRGWQDEPACRGHTILQQAYRHRLCAGKMLSPSTEGRFTHLAP